MGHLPSCTLSSAAAVLVVLVLAVLGGCTSSAETATPPADTAIPFSSPAGGSDADYDVDAFDPCAPFTSTLWIKAAVVDPQLAPQAAPQPGGGCRWRGPEMSASVAVARGRSLRDINTDPAYRTGERGWDGNSFWRTAMWDGTRTCDAFLAAGPARPDTVVHVFVETEHLEAPLRGGGDARACVFASTLVSASSLVLDPARPSTR